MPDLPTNRGHCFDERLVCRCGAEWAAQQEEPTECAESAREKHRHANTSRVREYDAESSRRKRRDEIDPEKRCAGSRVKISTAAVQIVRGDHPNGRQKWTYRVCKCQQCGRVVPVELFRRGTPRVMRHERAG